MITSLHTSKYSQKERKEKHWIPSRCPILVMPLLMCFTEPKEQQSCISGYHGKRTTTISKALWERVMPKKTSLQSHLWLLVLVVYNNSYFLSNTKSSFIKSQKLKVVKRHWPRYPKATFNLPLFHYTFLEQHISQLNQLMGWFDCEVIEFVLFIWV